MSARPTPEPQETRAWEWLCREYLEEPARPDDLAQHSRIRRSMLEQAESYVHASRQSAPPTELRTLLKERGVTRFVEANLGFRDGLLLEGPDGLEVRVNSNAHQARRRAAIAHELGHTFFFDITRTPPRRGAEFPRTRYWVEEGIARELGRAMLMPRKWLKEDGVPDGDALTIASLRRLSERYDVSLEILLYRLFRDLKAVDAVVLFAAIDHNEPASLRIPASGRFKGPSYSRFRVPAIVPYDDKLTSLALRIQDSDLRSVASSYANPWGNAGLFRLEVGRQSTDPTGRFVVLLTRPSPRVQVQPLGR